MPAGKMTIGTRRAPGGRRVLYARRSKLPLTKRINSAIVRYAEKQQEREIDRFAIGEIIAGLAPGTNAHVTNANISPSIPLGTALINRTGNKIRLQSMNFAVQITNNTAVPTFDGAIRFILINAQNPVVGDNLAVPSSGGFSLVETPTQLRRNGAENFRVLHDRVYKLDSVGNYPTIDIKKTLKHSKILRFRDAIDASPENFSIQAFCFAANTGGGLSGDNIICNVQVVYNYTDM